MPSAHNPYAEGRAIPDVFAQRVPEANQVPNPLPAVPRLPNTHSFVEFMECLAARKGAQITLSAFPWMNDDGAFRSQSTIIQYFGSEWHDRAVDAMPSVSGIPVAFGHVIPMAVGQQITKDQIRRKLHIVDEPNCDGERTGSILFECRKMRKCVKKRAVVLVNSYPRIKVKVFQNGMHNDRLKVEVFSHIV